LWPDSPDSIVVDYEVFKERAGRAANLSELRNHPSRPLYDRRTLKPPAAGQGLPIKSAAATEGADAAYSHTIVAPPSTTMVCPVM
jgi:hypothetical protein